MTKNYIRYHYIMKYAMTIILTGLCLWAYSIPFTGGELSYKRIKTGLYEFTLVLERDCNRFATDFEFRKTVAIGAYNLRNELIGECGENGRIFLKLKSITKKTNNLQSACIVGTAEECREIAVYKGTAHVPISAYGYQFIYSDCCRTDNMKNIYDPENTGFTLTSTLTLNGYLWYTSTPVFSNTDPLYSCVGEENTFNPGVHVLQHEEYRFSLCTPYDGERPNGDESLPKAPPYEHVKYKTGYSGQSPLGEDGEISIDTKTGVITYTGNKAGSYAIAICVDQYKKGRLVGTNIHEIQLNFTDCAGKKVQADFDYTVDFCNEGRVLFENLSTGADSFEWTFYTDENTSTTSTNPNPVMTFPGTGSYLVELAVVNEEGCVDTARKVVEVFNFNTDVGILNFGNCADLTQKLSLDKKIRNYELTWYLVAEDGLETEIGKGEEISYTFPSEGSYLVRVSAEFEDCMVTATRRINVVQGVTLLMDTLILCSPDIVALNPNAFDQYNYQWNIDSLIEDKNNPNPRVFVSNTTLFPVTISEKDDPTCTGEGFVLVEVGENLSADFESVQNFCSEDGFEVTFNAITEGISNTHWTFIVGQETIETDEESPVITFPVPGYYYVALAGDTESGCSAAGNRLFEVVDPSSGIRILNFGNCQNFEQVLKLDAPVDGFDVTWTLIDGESETEIGTGEQISYDFGAEGEYTVRAEITNPECTVVVTNVLVVKLGVTVPQDTIDICESANIMLNPVAYEGYNYQWLNNDLIDDVNSSSPVVTVTETTLFRVIVTDKNDPTCVDTGFVWVRLGELLLADYSANQDLCSEELTVNFSPVAADVVEAHWTFHIGGEVLESDELNPSIEFPVPGFYPVTLSVITTQGCEEQFARLAQVYDPATDLGILNFGNCTDYNQVLMLDKPVEGYDITWTLVKDGTETEIGTGNQISYDFGAEGNYTVRADISNPECTLAITDILVVKLGVTVPQDTIDICQSANIQLNPIAFDGYNYKWLNSNIIDDVNNPSPVVNVTETTLFAVVVTDKNDPDCVDTGYILVRFDELQLAAFNAVQDICADGYSVQFSPATDGIIETRWIFRIGGEEVQSFDRNPVVEFPATGFYEVSLSVVTTQGCVDSLTRLIEVFDPATDLNILNFGNCENYEQVLKLNKEIQGFDISWTLVEGDTETEIGTGTQITYDFGAEGNYRVRAEISNSECTISVEDVLVVTLGVTVPKDTIDICMEGGVILNPVSYDGYNYQWFETDLIDDVNDPSPEVNVTETTLFQVVVSDTSDIDCVDTGFVLVRINELPVAEFKAVQDLCADGFAVTFQPLMEGLASVEWTFTIGGEKMTSTEFSPVIEFPATGFYEISLSAVSMQGCTGTTTRLIEVFNPSTDLHILNFGNCENYEQVLKLNKEVEGFDISWTLLEGDTETEIGAGTQITYDFGAEGNYRVRAEISNSECTIVVEDVLVVTLGVTVPRDTIELCIGGNVTLNPVSYEGYNYQWLNTDLIDDVNNPSPVVNATETTLFQVIVTDTSDVNCVDTGFVLVRINELPVADFNAVYDICDVDKTMKFEPVNPNLISTTWFFDGNDPSKTSTENSPSFTYDAFGNYEVTLIAESVQGCTDTVTRTVQVDDFFAILDFKTNGGCEGLDYTLELNDPAIGYMVNWYLDENGDLTPIGQGVKLNYTFEASGRYDIRVELANAECARSFVKTIQVTDGIEAPDTTIVVCEPGLIALNTFGRNDLIYNWTPSDNLDNPESYNPVANITEDITYQVTVETQDGDSTCSATGTVQVILDQSTDSIAFDTTTLTICEGDLVFLNDGGDTSLIYYWQPESFFEDARIPNPSTRLYTSQVFVVTITDPVSGCSQSFRRKVNVIPVIDGITIDYTFECGSTAATITAMDLPAEATVEWTYQDSIVSTESTFEIDFGSFGTFDVTARLTSGGCMESTAQITLFNPDVPMFQDTIYVCEPEKIVLNPDGDTSLIYKWTGPNLESNNIASPTANVEMNSIYSALIIHPKDTTCQTTGRVYVFVETDADIISTEQVEFCMGDTARLSVGDGGNVMSIQWFDPDGVVVGNAPSISFLFEKMGDYTVIAQINGCDFMDTINLQFRNAQIIASKTEGICPGDEVMLELSFNTQEPYDSIVWGPADVVVSDSDPALATYSPDSNSIVTAWVYFSDGCLSMDTVMLRIPPALEDLTISTDQDTLIRGQKATLTASNGNFTTYRWEPAEFVDNPDQAQTQVIPDQTTTFTLTATDANGCSVQRTITIVVLNPQCEPPYVFVPRAFSPNGDGMNDILYVRGESIDEVQFIVYDRWGEKMFETNNKDRGWDGTFQGKALPPNVYGYYLSVTCLGGDTYTEKGNVTIIR